MQKHTLKIMILLNFVRPAFLDFLLNYKNRSTSNVPYYSNKYSIYMYTIFEHLRVWKTHIPNYTLITFTLPP